MAKGWISIHRELMDNSIWTDSEPFDKRSAWIDLLLMANHKDFKAVRKMTLVHRKRGEVNTSLYFLAERWRWDRRKVKRFLDLLESDGMVSVHSTTDGTTVTIENYEKYQTPCTTDGTTDGTAIGTTDGTTDGTNDNKDNKYNKGNKNNNIGHSATPTPSEAEKEFEELWNLYPKKAGKKPALEKYKRVRRDKTATFDEIKKGIEAYARYVSGKEQRYILNGSSYFNQERWRDDYETEGDKTYGKRMGQVHNGTTPKDSRGMAGAVGRGNSGNEERIVRFPEVAYSFSEEA